MNDTTETTETTETTGGAFRLTAEQVQRLRTDHPYYEDLAWLVELVQTRGWLAGNMQYLRRERERSAEAMRDLMREFGVQEVTRVDDALELIRLACVVFAPDTGFRGTTTLESECQLRITNEQCPVYRSFEDQHWLGVTACPSWHRRRGWIDALGVLATDTVLAEKKWGDPACVTVVEVMSRLA